MPSSFEKIRPSTERDIPALNALFKKVFREERAPQVWEWKYFRNPRGNFSFLAEADGRVISHCGGTPVIFRDGGETRLALQSVDFMSDPAYPGGLGSGGVFARMVKAFFAQYCGPSAVTMVYGFPGERHRLFGERVLGYAPVEHVGELILQPRGESRVVAQPLASNLALLSQVQTPFLSGAVRDETYLRWRYVDHAVHRYELVKVKGFFSAPLGAIIRRTNDEVLLMDLIGTASPRNIQKIIAKLAMMGRPVRAWASLAHASTKALLDGGFVAAPRDHLIECRFFDGRPLPSAGEFYYSLGDYDVY